MFQLRFEIAIAIIIAVNLSFRVGASLTSFRIRSSEECITPGGGRGICKNIHRCDPLLGLLIKGKSRPRPWVVDFLKRSHCGFEGSDPVVCCPAAVKSKDPRAKENASVLFSLFLWRWPKYTNVSMTLAYLGVVDVLTIKKPAFERFLNKSCGSIQTLDKVIGGSVAAEHEFPWMALIGYNTSFGLRYRCGGSLISSRYILTAAHCVTALKDIYPISVRLGEYDMQSSEECDESAECNPLAKDIGIEELIPHPLYFKPELRNDIALIRLAKRVEYSDHIRPICLPLNKDLRSRSFLDDKAIVAGWGTTEFGISAKVLRKVTLPIVPLEECSKVYRRKAPITDWQICAGGERGRDSCSGDSGGPLQVLGVNPSGEAAYIQEGIVSFGPRICGTRGMPGVYTRVARYVDWILSTVKE